MMDTVEFMGHPCAVLENAALQLLIPRSVGPRVLSLRFAGGENLLAEIPHFVTECPGAGTFHFYGGHRLWHAPEDLRRTYLPDDAPVTIAPLENGLSVTQAVEPRTGLQKSIEIRLQGGAPRVELLHRLTNHGLWEVTCAPWAITQFKPGGVAVLPQAQTQTGVLPNRSLALWDYTDMANPQVTWGREYVLVNAAMQAPFKIGFPNPRGWLAYWLGGALFVKRARHQAHSAYYDFGSSSECYCNDQFLELETLAPISTLAPGTSVEHVEAWEIFAMGQSPQTEDDARALVAALNLG